ncbi:MAG: nitroreductase family protein [Tissierellales bacterium]|jgi:predicted oxidoreductase (fatty acid repression mutant protein)|nr:nitroreductase family protein [Tissierellales bacterium]
MEYNYKEAIGKRRSIYELSKESTISDDEIQDILVYALDHTPSAFNSQSGRVVLLLDNEHNELWLMIEEELRKRVPAERFESTKKKMDGFREAYGTVLFFEDYSIVEELENKFPRYAHNFSPWSYQSSGMLQYNIWTSFAIEGMGASLQHYNEVIEEAVKQRWDIPSKWKLISQMPFGKIKGGPGNKEIIPADDKMKIFK